MQAHNNPVVVAVVAVAVVAVAVVAVVVVVAAAVPILAIGKRAGTIAMTDKKSLIVLSTLLYFWSK